MYLKDEATAATAALGLNATLSGATPAAGPIVDVRDHLAATLGLATGAVTDAGGGFRRRAGGRNGLWHRDGNVRRRR